MNILDYLKGNEDSRKERRREQEDRMAGRRKSWLSGGGESLFGEARREALQVGLRNWLPFCLSALLP